MANDSSTGGYLVPAATPAPLQGRSLEDFLHDVVAGITGLDGKLVRPRLQPEPPAAPDYGTAWCAFGIQNRQSDAYAYFGHDAGDPDASDPVEASDQMRRHQTLNVLASFYDLGAAGDADELAQVLSDGLLVPQNREVLRLAGMAVQDVGDVVPAVPVLTGERWQYRCDLPIVLRRQIRRSYPILNVASGQFRLLAEDPSGETVADETVNVTEL